MDIAFLGSWLGSVPAFAVPLLLASVGLIVSERAGVLSLGAEGYLALGAMSAVAVTLSSGNLFYGVAAGVLAGALLALLFGIAVVVFHCEQTLAGLACMAIGLGLSGWLGRPFVHQPVSGLPALDFGVLAQLPVLGKLLFAQDALVYIAVGLTLLLAWAIAHSRWGLRLRAVGEAPETADVAGVNVTVQRLLAVTLCGALCGVGGAYLSVVASNIWVENMVAGRGWIALALVIFARWQPARALAGALLFGAIQALLPRLQAIGFNAPVYLMGMLPYLLTIGVLVLATRSRHGAEPAALGRAYLRQDRR